MLSQGKNHFEQKKIETEKSAICRKFYLLFTIKWIDLRFTIALQVGLIGKDFYFTGLD
jgi:hypothetical protein